MPHPLLSSSVIDKVANLALGCCIAGGVVSVGAGAAAVLPAAVSLGAVFTAMGLQRLIRDKPACQQALKQVKQQIARDLVAEGEAAEPDIRQALVAFDAALVPEQVFTLDALRSAVGREAQVVSAMTAHVLDEMARRDAVFNDEGLARDLAHRILTVAFSRAIEACPPFKDRANLVLAEVTLDELRSVAGQLSAIGDQVAGLNQKVDGIGVQLEALSKRLPREDLQTLQARIGQLESERAFSRQLIRNLLARTLDRPEIKDEALLSTFEAQVEIIAPIIAESARPSNSGEVAQAREAVRMALQGGEIDAAVAAYTRAIEVFAEIRRATTLEEAEMLEGRARLAAADLRPEAAQADFQQAGDLLRDLDPAKAAFLYSAAGVELHRIARFRAGTASRDAINLFRKAMPLFEQAGDDTGLNRTRARLGFILSLQASRQAGVEAITSLREAIDLMKQAQRVMPRDDDIMPRIHAHLGSAYSGLGRQLQGPAGVEAYVSAVEAYQAAREAAVAKGEALVSLQAGHLLSAALRSLGERAKGHLAIDAFKRAIAVANETLEAAPADLPKERAGVEISLGSALWGLATVAPMPERLGLLEKAEQATIDGLSNYDRQAMPIAFATATHNLGGILLSKGGLLSGEAARETYAGAVRAFRDVLTIYNPEESRLLWGESQDGLARALFNLAPLSADQEPVLFAQAAQAFKDGLTAVGELDAKRSAQAQFLQAQAMTRAASLQPEDALSAYFAEIRALLKTSISGRWTTPGSMEHGTLMAAFAGCLIAEEMLHDDASDPARLNAVIDAADEALDCLSPDGQLFNWALARQSRAVAGLGLAIEAQDREAFGASLSDIRQIIDRLETVGPSSQLDHTRQLAEAFAANELAAAPT